MYRKLAGACAVTLCCSALAAAPEPYIEASFYSQNDPFIRNYAASLQELADSSAEKLTINYAQEDLVKEYQQLQLATKNGAGALIVNPVDPTSIHQIIDLADKNELPVIFVNREPIPNELNAYSKAWFVGTDSNQAGTYQADMLTRYVLDHPAADRNGDGSISYLLLQGEKGLSDTVYRTLSLQHSLDNSPVMFKQEAAVYANWQFDQAMQAADAFVRQHGFDKLEAIVANNDDMALGALQFLKSKGYNSGDPAKFIPIVGIDASSAALKAVKAGEMIGTVKNDYAAQARAAFRLAYMALHGKEISRTTTGYYFSDGRSVYIPYVKVYFE